MFLTNYKKAKLINVYLSYMIGYGDKLIYIYIMEIFDIYIQLYLRPPKYTEKYECATIREYFNCINILFKCLLVFVINSWLNVQHCS